MAETPIKIGLIICSTRNPRKGPAIAAWVTQTLTASLPAHTTLTTIDLADHPLPLSPCDPLIPAHLSPSPPASTSSSTASQPPTTAAIASLDPSITAWSRTILAHHAFIFLTPQYNWSFPAAVKCAIDHLFHEWVGKPVFVISYGNRGGGKAARQLGEVLVGGCRMVGCTGGKGDGRGEAKGEGERRGERGSGNFGAVELVVGGGGDGLDSGAVGEVTVGSWEEAGKGEELCARGRELVALVGVAAAAGAAGRGGKNEA